MQTTVSQLNAAPGVARYFAKAQLPSEQQTLGNIAAEIFSDGRSLNRKSICSKLLSRLERAETSAQEKHLNRLLEMLLD